MLVGDGLGVVALNEPAQPPQERHIAELARDGLSYQDIGARRYLSPRTVEWHLRHVYSKLSGAAPAPDDRQDLRS